MNDTAVLVHRTDIVDKDTHLLTQSAPVDLRRVEIEGSARWGDEGQY